jgi:hypothetical protein
MSNHALAHDLLTHDYHYRKLAGEHAEIERQLESLRQAPSVDITVLAHLKRLKLQVRDKMSLLEKEHHRRRH